MKTNIVPYSVLSKNNLIHQNNNSITRQGTIAVKDFDTAGGTESGIFITKFFLTINIKISVILMTLK